MAKIPYRDYNPKAHTLVVIQEADSILQEYSRQGYRLSVRQLYYVFISRDLFPDDWIDEEYNGRKGLAADTKNTDKNYGRLKSICTAAREGGLLDWNHITDRGRQLEQNPHWRDPERFLSSVCPQFKLDWWLDQPRRVEVWVEKDALSEVIARACEPLDVPYFACKGYASSSSVWEAGCERFLKKYAQRGQAVTVLHLSDHDASGLDMTRDLSSRLRMFSTRTNSGQRAARVTVRRIALTMAQVEEYNPPPNPAKETDPRSAGYVSEYGEDSWELDALMAVGPSVLIDLVQGAIHEEMEEPELFEVRKGLQRQALEQLEQISDDYATIMDQLGLDHLDCGDEPD